MLAFRRGLSRSAKLIFVFAHDHVFSRSFTGTYYSDGKLVSASWDRYLEHCTKLYVVCRVQDIEDESIIHKLDVSSRENVVFVPVKGASQFSILFRNYCENSKLIRDVVAQSDLVILRIPSFISLLACVQIIRLKKKYCVEVVASASESLLSILGKKGLLFAYLLEVLTKYLAKNANGAVYVTRAYLQKKYPNYLFQMAASNIELPTLDGDVIKRRQISMLDSGVVRLGLIGSYTQKYKGIDTAIIALGLLNKSGRNYTLDVVGKGDSVELRDLAASLGVGDKVFFTGTKKAGNEIYQWLDTVDIYIQPSRTEGLPRALIEAMSRGCPVVASNVGGIPELIETRFLHEVDDVEALAEKVRLLAENSELRKRQALLNFEKASEYSADRLKQIRSSFYLAMAREAAKA